MKQYSSNFLKSTAVFYMSFPISFIAIAAVLFDVPARSCMSVLLSPSYLVLSLLAVLVGYGFWEMKRWSWYFFVVTNILIAYLCAVVASDYGETHYRVATFAFSLLMIAGLTYRVASEIRVPYFFPKIRWWESDPRYRLSVPVKLIRLNNGEPVAADILDLSMGGCFLKLRNDLAQDEKIRVEFTVFQIPVSCEGTIVWRTRSTVTHPKGVGVKFLEIEKSQKRGLKLIHRRLKRITQFYKRARYLMSQEEFVKRLQELESTPHTKRRKKLASSETS